MDHRATTTIEEIQDLEQMTGDLTDKNGSRPAAGGAEEPGACAFFLTLISFVLIVMTFPFSLFLCVKVVQEYERAVIFRLGRLLRGGAKGPGIFFIIPCIDTYCKVDLRTVSFDVPPQEILSKDSVTVAVDAVVYYRISNATIAVSNVEDYGHSTRLLAATTLRNVLGTRSLSEVLTERESISHVMQSFFPDPRFFWQVIAAGGAEEPGACAFFLTLISFVLIVMTFPFSLFLCVKVVQEYERAVIFRLGRLLRGGAKGPGIFFIIPCIDTYCKVDLRTVSFDVPPQEILSKDSVTVAVDAVVYYRISNATIAVSNVEDYGHSTRLLAATTLRNVLGTRSLSEVLTERESISHVMQSSLDEGTDPWGVKVERVEIKDVRLPVQLQRAMAAEAEAAREARAKVIAAEGEQRASRALKEASEVISGSPAALQLRYLQTLNSIAAEKNSTIVFPIPMEFFQVFMKSQENGESNPETR
ncbi:hypothetical protein LAZ67_7002448 [Cordylochernes scorpioides]|uniref:Band 7 domain-containing protein n=1 Tax=Cordylochernes scorpioides TaxID=51811 RepID=A0ABY6KN68_9ARAC|nr:hypothetical protein LAZ67_7002448 [Cordylochernes scorpioides]